MATVIAVAQFKGRAEQRQSDTGNCSMGDLLAELVRKHL